MYLLILIGLIPLFIGISKHMTTGAKSMKAQTTRKYLTMNNKFVQENKDKIEQIIKNHNKYRRSIFIRWLRHFIFWFILSILIIVILGNTEFIVIAMFIAFIIWICLPPIMLVFMNSEYENSFKNDIEKIVKNYNSKFDYNYYSDFSSDEYDLCRFKERYNRFESRYQITNKSNEFEFSAIKSFVESQSANLDSYATYTFVAYEGALSKINIKNCNCEIFLGNFKEKNDLFDKNNRSNTKFKQEKDKYKAIQLENDEFNKLFHAYTDNELAAHKVLTPNVMEQLVDLKNNTFGDIDIRILNDKLYIRFLTGSMFKPSLLNKKKEKDNIISSIAVLDEIYTTMNIAREIINNK